MAKKFPWGKVQDIHNIGPYEIIEYDEYHSNKRLGSTGRILYHVEENNHSYNSLDEAIIGAIVFRMAGFNNDAIATHFMAGLKAMEPSND